MADDNTPLDIELLSDEQRKFYEDMEYAHVCKINGKIVGISQFLYTTGIVCGMNETGYEHRFCYHTPHEAMGALIGWIAKGGDEPTGYIKRKG